MVATADMDDTLPDGYTCHLPVTPFPEMEKKTGRVPSEYRMSTRLRSVMETGEETEEKAESSKQKESGKRRKQEFE